MKKSIVCTVLVLILALNYYKTFDTANTLFDNFRSTSQILAEFSIFAGSNDMDKKAYGLGKIEFPGEVTLDGLDLDWIEEENIGINSLIFRPYKSQVGLQGTVYYYMAKILPVSYDKLISLFMKICALLTAIVAFMIAYLIGKKMNRLMALSFYLVFLLSPWICIYGRDLYWVAFTWFLPMLNGIVSVLLDDKKRKWCYFGAFITIFIKAMCGYEYITTIMMSSVMFPLLECVTDNKETRKKYFKQAFLLGMFALMGFMTVLFIHAGLRGEGNVLAGIKEIYYSDILRRTVGVNGADADISTISVILMYLRFPTQIITGLDGNLFPYMVILVVAVIVYKRFFLHNADVKIEFLTAFSFLTTISWFALAKDHSYNHPHMNYVLWYFGFIQMCLYVIMDFIKSIMDRDRQKI